MPFTVSKKLKSVGPYFRPQQSPFEMSSFSYIFIFIVLLQEGRAGETWEPTKKIMHFFLDSWFRASWFNVNKKVQLDATVCRNLFTAKSLYMFRASQRPLSWVLKTVTATSGIGHNTGTATFFQRGLIRPRWKEVAVPVLWPIPEVAVTVFSTPDDGRCEGPKRVEWLCSE